METQAALFDLSSLLTRWNLLLVVAVWTLIQTARTVLPGLLGKDGKLKRLLPVLPILICQGMVWIPGPWLAADASMGERIVLGVVLGALTANGHAVVSKLGLHKFLPGFMNPDVDKKAPTIDEMKETPTDEIVH